MKNSEANKEAKITASSSNDDKLLYLDERTPFSLPKVFCDCMRNRKDKNAKEKGLRRIDKELEIDNFLKQQIKLKVAISALFSKVERFLIKNNKRFVIQTDSSDADSSSSPVTREQMHENINDHQYQKFAYLLEQTGLPLAFEDEPSA